MKFCCSFMLLSQFPLTSHQTQIGMPRFIVQLITILMLIGMLFKIISDVPQEDIFKLSAFVSGFRLELMYASLIVSIMSILIHPTGLQLLALLPQFTEITFFVCNSRINILNLKYSSDRLLIAANGFLKLPNLQMPTKQKSLPLTRNLTLRTSGELLIVFSTKINLQDLLYSTARRCFLHLIKQSCLLKTFLRTLIL